MAGAALMSHDNFKHLHSDICSCRLCPRLVHFRENVAIRNANTSEKPWRKPVPGFGDPNAWLLILGLAPSASGGNRTGRIFTGDLSGKFLMACLHNKGLANHSYSESREDGLMLKGCYMTAGVKCVPPDNKPSNLEIDTCRQYLKREFFLLSSIRAVLALGQTSLKMYRDYLREEGHEIPTLKFHHGAHYKMGTLPKVYASYHPSPQNTQTGKLTARMFETLLQQILDEN
jgi:uracil-DNA glycosylase family 4